MVSLGLLLFMGWLSPVTQAVEARPVSVANAVETETGDGLGDAGRPPWSPPPRVLDWVTEHWHESGSVRQRSAYLRRLLVSPGGLGLRETPGASHVAAEVVRRQQADCVGFAMLYAGLARSMGLGGTFAIEGTAGLVARGGIGARSGWNVLEGHLVVLLESDGQPFVVDFSGVRRATGAVRAIADRAASAILWSNVGAHSLLAGRCGMALAFTRRAAEAAPELSSIRGNLAAVERACGGPGASRGTRLAAQRSTQ